MSDSYQAIYDAVRSRISNGDVGDAIREVAFRQFDISNATHILTQEISCAAANIADAMSRPSVLYRPTLTAYGASWRALLGDNIQVGVAGFGDTPEKAMRAFDEAFLNERTPIASRQLRAAQAILDEESEQERQDNGQFGVGA